MGPMSLETSTHYASLDDPPPFPLFALIAFAFAACLVLYTTSVSRQHDNAHTTRTGPVRIAVEAPRMTNVRHATANTTTRRTT